MLIHCHAKPDSRHQPAGHSGITQDQYCSHHAWLFSAASDGKIAVWDLKPVVDFLLSEAQISVSPPGSIKRHLQKSGSVRCSECNSLNACLSDSFQQLDPFQLESVSSMTGTRLDPAHPSIKVSTICDISDPGTCVGNGQVASADNKDDRHSGDSDRYVFVNDRLAEEFQEDSYHPNADTDFRCDINCALAVRETAQFCGIGGMSIKRRQTYAHARSPQTDMDGDEGTCAKSPQTEMGGDEGTCARSPQTEMDGDEGTCAKSPQTEMDDGEGTHAKYPQTEMDGGEGTHAKYPQTQMDGVEGTCARSPQAEMDGDEVTYAKSPQTEMDGGEGTCAKSPQTEMDGVEGTHAKYPQTEMDGGEGRCARSLQTEMDGVEGTCKLCRLSCRENCFTNLFSWAPQQELSVHQSGVNCLHVLSLSGECDGDQ